MSDTEQNDAGTWSGARRVAIFLSILDPGTAETLLGMFEPETTREIAREAGRIVSVSREEAEQVVGEFLEIFGTEDALGAEYAAALAEEARRNAGLTVPESSEEGYSGPLAALAPDELATVLEDCNPAIKAAALTLLPPSKREALARMWSDAELDLVRRCLRALPETDPSRRPPVAIMTLEDALAERAVEDE